MSEIKRPAPEMLMSQQGGGGGHRRAPLHGGQVPCSTSLPGVPTRADLLVVLCTLEFEQLCSVAGERWDQRREVGALETQRSPLESNNIFRWSQPYSTGS